MYHALPSLIPDTSFGVFNNTVRVAGVALTERYLNLKVGNVLTKPIQPQASAFLIPTLQEFAAKLVKFTQRKARVYSHEEVVEMYTGPKRRVYEQALVTYRREGVTREDSYLTTFIKFEKTNIDKAPRVINPRKPVYNLCLARYLKKLEKHVYRSIHKAFNSQSNHTVFKGMNIVESAADLRVKWDRFIDPVAVGGDITKLDMHISKSALEFEHSIYNRIFRNRKLKQLLRWQLHNKGHAVFKDGHITFSMDGTRSSGDINTSLGNVIIVCACIYELTKFGFDFEVVNNGDDFVLITESANLHYITDNLPNMFRHKGFVLQMETPVYRFEEIEFCQTKPVYDGCTWRMVRLPQTVLKKDTICLIPLQNDKIFQKWLRAVGDAGISLCKGIPVLESFYRLYQRSGIAYNDSFIKQVFKNTSYFTNVRDLAFLSDIITQEARLSFYYAFGVTPDQQVCIENYFNNVSIGLETTVLAGLIRDNNLIHNGIQL